MNLIMKLSKDEGLIGNSCKVWANLGQYAKISILSCFTLTLLKKKKKTVFSPIREDLRDYYCFLLLLFIYLKKMNELLLVFQDIKKKKSGKIP